MKKLTALEERSKLFGQSIRRAVTDPEFHHSLRMRHLPIAKCIEILCGNRAVFVNDSIIEHNYGTEGWDEFIKGQAEVLTKGGVHRYCEVISQWDRREVLEERMRDYYRVLGSVLNVHQVGHAKARVREVVEDKIGEIISFDSMTIGQLCLAVTVLEERIVEIMAGAKIKPYKKTATKKVGSTNYA